MTNPPQPKSGLWRPVTDDPEMLDGRPQPHGTYTKAHYYRFVLRSEKGIDNKILYIFDDNGEFGYFVWNDSDAWTPRNEPVTFEWPADDPEKQLGVKEGTSVTIYPKLMLLPPSQNTPYYPVPSDDQVLRNSQSIRYEEFDRKFVWKQEHAVGKEPLKFTHVHTPDHRQEALAKDDRFDYVFNKSQLSNFAFPFYGYKALSLDVFAAALSSKLAAPGTRARSYKNNEGQGLSGTLIFSFPEPGSKDYDQWSDRAEQPKLPLGIRADQIKVSQRSEQTRMISTLAERVDSWSLSVGFNAGVKKGWSLGGEGTYKETVQKQNEKEFRYVVARKVRRDYAYIIREEAMEIHSSYLRAIRGTLGRLLTDKDPEWQSFIDEFGTHYAHAVTLGSLEIAETQLSLQAESTTYAQKLDVKATASAALSGVGAKSEALLSKEWSTRLGTKIETSDVKCLAAGDDHNSVPIFYDLRPTSELMSPLYFPYNPLEPWERVAPFVWCKLRKSYEDFLKGKGLNQPLANDVNVDFRSRIVSISISKLIVRGPDTPGNNSVNVAGKLTLTPNPMIGIEYHPDGESKSTMEIPAILIQKGENIIGQVSKLDFWNKPTAWVKGASCVLIAKPGDVSDEEAPIGKISGSLTLRSVWTQPFTYDLAPFHEIMIGKPAIHHHLPQGFTLEIGFKIDNEPLMQRGE